MPLSLPGIFAAVIFGFVGCFGESAVPVIMGGVGYQLIGNTITSTLDVLNYPLAAAMSSIVVLAMLVCSPLVSRLRHAVLPRQDPELAGVSWRCTETAVRSRARSGSMSAWCCSSLSAAGPTADFLRRARRGRRGDARWYVEIWRNPCSLRAIVTTLKVGFIVAVTTPFLGLAAAMAIRELGRRG